MLRVVSLGSIGLAAKSLDRLAAVDDHGVADHEGGRVRAQPDDGRGDLLGLAHPPDRLLRDHLRPPLGRAPGEAAHHRRVDVPGADGVDAEVLRGVVEGGRLGQADHAVLGGGVRGAALDADDPGARGRVHDRPAALLEDQRDLVLHAQEHAAEVDVDDPVPLLLVVVRGRGRLLRLDAGVVEGEVQPPERLDRLRQGRLHVLGPRHVAPHGDRPPALLLDQAGRLPVALLGHVGGHHAGPLAGERQRRRAADAVRGPGHERHLSCEAPIRIRCHFLLLWLPIREVFKRDTGTKCASVESCASNRGSMWDSADKILSRSFCRRL